MACRPWFRRHRTAVDVGIAVCFTGVDTAGTVLGATWWPERPGTLAWCMLALQAAACMSLAFRRRAPLTVVAVLGTFTLAVSLLVWPAEVLAPADPGQVWAPFSTALAAYGPLFYQDGCGSDRDNRRRTVIALALFTLVVARPWQPSATVITIGVLRTALGPLLAMYFDARRRLVQALTERAERAERERHLLAEQARAEERARLAGEMHDVVTHRVSLMALQAGALRMTARDEATRQAAEELRAAGCQALEELRDLVGILRTEPEGDDRSYATPPATALADLVAESTAVGVAAELVEEGDPALASPVVGRTAYRLVREALTNVRKHAPGARVTVRAVYGEARVLVSVENTAPVPVAAGAEAPPGSDLAATGSGLGIPDLRRRIELVQGTMRAGPAPGGGFRIEASLPAYVPTAETAV
jgi:signal transduction histidine kinase